MKFEIGKQWTIVATNTLSIANKQTQTGNLFPAKHAIAAYPGSRCLPGPHTRRSGKGQASACADRRQVALPRLANDPVNTILLSLREALPAWQMPRRLPGEKLPAVLLVWEGSSPNKARCSAEL
jgi:hypothetical protein